MIRRNSEITRTPVNQQYPPYTLIGRTVKHLALYNRIDDINYLLEEILSMDNVDDYPEVLTLIISYVKPSDIVY